MKICVTFIIVYLTVTTNARRKGKILNGRNAFDHRHFPYLVAIEINVNEIAGGSILNQRWILTAAHCFAGKNVSSIVVYAGANNLLSRQLDIYQVESYIYHKNYIEKGYWNDIALVRVDTNIRYNANVQPIDLPIRNFNHARDSVTFAGWGSTKRVNGNWWTTNDLQMTEINIIDQNECRRELGYWNIRILDSQICVFKESGGLCYGDSGSPLVVDGVVIGLASFLLIDCELEMPNVFTRVYNYLDWIYDCIRNYPKEKVFYL